ncbi:C1 family peptidase [Inhella sp.]|uniref:C1 family peptidase n=1 Tax=Inhella sp. TaxID=1921806 RepID=UPI0035B16C76
MAKKKPLEAWRLVARPDALDPRDRRFVPNVALAPKATLFPPLARTVKHQGQTSACTGFALSTVVEHLLARAGREKAPAISPFMLYSMAQRYDAIPGHDPEGGSSLRGALKGWFKHGACAEALFSTLEMPPAPKDIRRDWWYEAVQRPLGAYYRIDPQHLVDMHAALNEVGILYASSACHSGWGSAVPATRAARPRGFAKLWEIPFDPAEVPPYGHAFAIVGYNERGFLVQNSWGEGWGSGGYALISYADWLQNGMDCWVAQLGVVTQDHRELAHSATLRLDAKTQQVRLAPSEVLRKREIAPFIVNIGNNGLLSNTGEFRTTPDDVRALAELQLARARALWKPKDGVVDVCIYAHGGLTDEREAADTAARWIKQLYEAQVLPVFLMWETGFWTSLARAVTDAVAGVPRSTAGFDMKRWWNRRLERTLAWPGGKLWGEMKQNADAISAHRDGAADEHQAGAVLLYKHFKHKVQDQKVRLHFVGHSAGAVVGCLMAERLCADGVLHVDSVSLMAPAARVELFQRTLKPLLQNGQVGRYQQFHLSAEAEERDPSCGPYTRSLLHLVAESFEGNQRQPILGLELDAAAALRGLPNVRSHVAPGPHSGASQHGHFDEDAATAKTVIDFIKQR